MKEFDYIIIGGGCAGLSLAYELEIYKKLENKTLAIVEPRSEYKKDKTWSFWKVSSHNFDDCVEKNWENFSINIPNNTKHLECVNYPYQAINSELFYNKINTKLKKNKNIQFFKDIKEVSTENSFIFNSVPNLQTNQGSLWQHFSGVEIETKKEFFNDQIINLMDFDCDQGESVHFFYTLPYSKNKALIESTWLSKMTDSSEKNYDNQIKNYIEKQLNIKDYKITYKEQGAIPLFYPIDDRKKNTINIGTAGGMTRLSTGYTFLNIQQQSKYIRENIEKISNTKLFKIDNKYKFLDEVFLKVLEKYPQKMPNIFFNMFSGSSNTVIKFLSNKSNLLEDLLIILKMPKLIFLKSLFK
tara:strand:- start:400 stop:1467 length:1068 start_codon:yes stop_codon:yes gene_type:complete